MRGYKEVLEYRYGSPGLLTHDKWIALPRRMALGCNYVSLNYRVFQQNRPKADIHNSMAEGSIPAQPPKFKKIKQTDRRSVPGVVIWRQCIIIYLKKHIFMFIFI